MIDKTKDFDDYKLEFIKNPVIAEFLGFKNNSKFTEIYVGTRKGLRVCWKTRTYSY